MAGYLHDKRRLTRPAAGDIADAYQAHILIYTAFCDATLKEKPDACRYARVDEARREKKGRAKISRYPRAPLKEGPCIKSPFIDDERMRSHGR
jgi:hypothetical protein